MSEKQAQPQLNGAYYGPAIPPPTRSYHSHGRNSGCGCGCCLLSFLFKIIITAVVLIGLAILIFWLVFRPVNKIKFHVTDASLTQFNLTTNNNLQYNLALNITVRNPNKKIGVYYDHIEARAFYFDQMFDSIILDPFYQGHKNTSFLRPVFDGQRLVVLGNKELAKFNEEKNVGVYSIDVKLYLRIRFKFGKIKVGKIKPKVKCDLKVPMNNVAGNFKATKCDIDF